MKLVIFGLTVSSSWGNGHATLWRGLCRALGRRGHEVVFFERDVPYYASHRDLTTLPAGRLVLYSQWADALDDARRELTEADAGFVTSYCPDSLKATKVMSDSSVNLRAFYDLDTPVTLSRLQAGQTVDYIGPEGLRDFDLVLSFTGGPALEELKTQLGARRVAPLYGSVDLESHHPTPRVETYRADLSYLGTYAEDRQQALETFFLEPARRLPAQKFLIGGAMYPADFPWAPNVFFARHVAPNQHAAFFCSSRLTLNITRGAMARMGYCPSGRLFEAAACGVPILTDSWEGLSEFYEPGSEICVARTSQDAVNALGLSEAELARIGRAARERTLEAHTADRRAEQLEELLQNAVQPELR